MGLRLFKIFDMPLPVARKILPAVGTVLSHSAVSSLDFELRKVREFQNSSRGVRTENLRPNSTFTAGKTFLATSS